MAIIEIDATSVSVSNFAELKIVLENYSTYAYVITVYLAADIELEGGISINPQRTTITIDGRNPDDATGETIHTITDHNSLDARYTIGVRSLPPAGMEVTYTHINWIGKNYYGILFVGNTTRNVVAIFDHITYTGPQMVFHIYNVTRLTDCTLTSAGGAVGYPQETIGEVGHLEIGGKTKITQTSQNYPIMYFRISDDYSLTILPNADVTMELGAWMLQLEGVISLPFRVKKDAKLHITSRQSLSRESDAQFSSVTIEEGASLIVRQKEDDNRSALYMYGEFLVEKNAVVDMQMLAHSQSPLVYFHATGEQKLTLNSPKSFILRSAYGSVTKVIDAAPLTSVDISISSQQVNFWDIPSSDDIAGKMNDTPLYSWRKSDNSELELRGSFRSGLTTLTDNLTDEERQNLAPIEHLQLTGAGTLSAGRIPLEMEPVIDNGEPVSGKTAPKALVKVEFTTDEETYSQTQNALEDGSFSFDTAFPIPVGTQVEVTVNTPFLIYKEILEAVDIGELYLMDPPATLEFAFPSIAHNPNLYGRADPNWKLEVVDSRVRSTPWVLYAASDGDLTSYDSQGNVRQTLPGALVYVDSEAVLHTIGETPVVIWNGAAKDGSDPLITTVTWSADKGMLMTTSTNPFWAGDRYTTNIYWTLEAVSE